MWLNVSKEYFVKQDIKLVITLGLTRLSGH